jgi:hypothetical protein
MINLQLGTYQAVRSRPKIENRLALAEKCVYRNVAIGRVPPQRCSINPYHAFISRAFSWAFNRGFNRFSTALALWPWGCFS